MLNDHCHRVSTHLQLINIIIIIIIINSPNIGGKSLFRNVGRHLSRHVAPIGLLTATFAMTLYWC